jgi:amidase/aspartyl-tRNA(Asn)/glutamyl-tRNA(Gln) amidotransferase subunit A
MVEALIIRSEVYDAIEGVLASHDLIVSPTLGAMQVDNDTNGETKGRTHIGGVEVDPLTGWRLIYLTNFSGHPAASIPAGLIGACPSECI